MVTGYYDMVTGYYASEEAKRLNPATGQALLDICSPTCSHNRQAPRSVVIHVIVPTGLVVTCCGWRGGMPDAAGSSRQVSFAVSMRNHGGFVSIVGMLLQLCCWV